VATAILSFGICIFKIHTRISNPTHLSSPAFFAVGFCLRSRIQNFREVQLQPFDTNPSFAFTAGERCVTSKHAISTTKLSSSWTGSYSVCHEHSNTHACVSYLINVCHQLALIILGLMLMLICFFLCLQPWGNVGMKEHLDEKCKYFPDFPFCLFFLLRPFFPDLKFLFTGLFNLQRKSGHNSPTRSMETSESSATWNLRRRICPLSICAKLSRIMVT
jgi:hypothetical protein